MTDSRTLPRPPQVTMAGWVTIVGSVLVVVGMFDGVATLRSLETQERVERLLKDPPFSGTGLSVDDWLSVMNVAYVVAAACAAATAILGWYALQRDRRTRVALTVLVVPLFLTGLFSGSFTTSVVTVAVVMLWTKPARDWFDGKAAPPAPVVPDRPAAVTPPVDPSGAPAPWAPRVQQRPAFVTARPDAVLYACLITWVTCGIVLLGCLGTILGVMLEPSVVNQVRDQQGAEGLPSSDGDLRMLVYLSLGVIAAYCVVAMVLAVFTFLQRTWARIALITSAVVSAFFCLAGVAAVIPLVPMAACLATAYLLFKPDVRAWFAAR